MDIKAARRFQATASTIDNFQACMVWQSDQPDLSLFTNDVAGEVAEVGVWKGHFSLCIAKHFPGRNIHLFDTFEGFPASEFSACDLVNKEFCHKEGDFGDTSIGMVKRLLSTHDCYNAIFHKGIFPATAGPVKDMKFCFVSIDLDLYKPTKAAWEFFYPRMVKGGTIVLYDDYYIVACEGATKATDEFLADKPEVLRFDVSEIKELKNLVYIMKEEDE